jgi:hypothetical protein
MKTKLILALAFLASACASTSGPGTNEAIQITQSSKTFQLSVPVSQLTMRVPRGTWFRKDKSALGGGTSNPRYFYFEDEKEESLILSGWFEPDRLYSGSAAKQWERDLPGIKKSNVPAPVNIAFERIGGWDTVMYDHVVGNAVSSHLRAHWVQAGTWIELHLSATTYRPSAENRKKLRSVLRGISIAEKGSARALLELTPGSLRSAG